MDAPTWRAYRRQVASYRHKMVPTGEPGVHTIYGWDEQALRYISLMQVDVAGRVAAVRALRL